MDPVKVPRVVWVLLTPTNPRRGPGLGDTSRSIKYTVDLLGHGSVVVHRLRTCHDTQSLLLFYSVLNRSPFTRSNLSTLVVLTLFENYCVL